jgi:hypothetical protein
MPAHPPAQPLLLRGSLISLSRRCGKPNCHCKDGEPHTTPALSYSRKGKTFILTLRPKDLPEVREALRNFRRAQRQLDAQALRGIRAFSARIRQDKRSRRPSS